MISVSFTIGSHIRDVDILAVPLDVEFRCGAFVFAQNHKTKKYEGFYAATAGEPAEVVKSPKAAASEALKKGASRGPAEVEEASS